MKKAAQPRKRASAGSRKGRPRKPIQRKTNRAPGKKTSDESDSSPPNELELIYSLLQSHKGPAISVKLQRPDGTWIQIEKGRLDEQPTTTILSADLPLSETASEPSDQSQICSVETSTMSAGAAASCSSSDRNTDNTTSWTEETAKKEFFTTLWETVLSQQQSLPVAEHELMPDMQDFPPLKPYPYYELISAGVKHVDNNVIELTDLVSGDHVEYLGNSETKDNNELQSSWTVQDTDAVQGTEVEHEAGEDGSGILISDVVSLASQSEVGSWSADCADISVSTLDVGEFHSSERTTEHPCATQATPEAASEFLVKPSYDDSDAKVQRDANDNYPDERARTDTLECTPSLVTQSLVCDSQAVSQESVSVLNSSCTQPEALHESDFSSKKNKSGSETGDKPLSDILPHVRPVSLPRLGEKQTIKPSMSAKINRATRVLSIHMGRLENDLLRKKPDIMALLAKGSSCNMWSLYGKKAPYSGVSHQIDDKQGPESNSPGRSQTNIHEESTQNTGEKGEIRQRNVGAKGTDVTIESSSAIAPVPTVKEARTTKKVPQRTKKANQNSASSTPVTVGKAERERKFSSTSGHRSPKHKLASTDERKTKKHDGTDKSSKSHHLKRTSKQEIISGKHLRPSPEKRSAIVTTKKSKEFNIAETLFKQNVPVAKPARVKKPVDLKAHFKSSKEKAVIGGIQSPQGKMKRIPKLSKGKGDSSKGDTSLISQGTPCDVVGESTKKISGKSDWYDRMRRFSDQSLEDAVKEDHLESVAHLFSPPHRRTSVDDCSGGASDISYPAPTSTPSRSNGQETRCTATIKVNALLAPDAYLEEEDFQPDYEMDYEVDNLPECQIDISSNTQSIYESKHSTAIADETVSPDRLKEAEPDSQLNLLDNTKDEQVLDYHDPKNVGCQMQLSLSLESKVLAEIPPEPPGKIAHQASTRDEVEDGQSLHLENPVDQDPNANDCVRTDCKEDSEVTLHDLGHDIGRCSSRSPHESLCTSGPVQTFATLSKQEQEVPTSLIGEKSCIDSDYIRKGGAGFQDNRKKRKWGISTDSSEPHKTEKVAKLTLSRTLSSNTDTVDSSADLSAGEEFHSDIIKEILQRRPEDIVYPRTEGVHDEGLVPEVKQSSTYVSCIAKTRSDSGGPIEKEVPGFSCPSTENENVATQNYASATTAPIQDTISNEEVMNMLPTDKRLISKESGLENNFQKVAMDPETDDSNTSSEVEAESSSSLSGEFFFRCIYKTQAITWQ